MFHLKSADGNQRLIDYSYFFLLTAIAVSLIIKFAVDKHLSADGVYFFFRVLETQKFTSEVWSRHFAEIATQWPLLLAVLGKITDLNILVNIYAVGIFSPYCFSFALSYLVVEKRDKNLLLIPLASYLMINMLGDYVLSIQHHVLALMTWPIVILLLKKRTFVWWEGILLWVLLVFFSRLYETGMVIAGTILLLCSYRVVIHKDRVDRIVTGISALLAIGIIAIGVYFTLNPQSLINRGNFLDSIWVIRGIGNYWRLGGFFLYSF